jgi:hypothetical protein
MADFLIGQSEEKRIVPLKQLKTGHLRYLTATLSHTRECARAAGGQERVSVRSGQGICAVRGRVSAYGRREPRGVLVDRCHRRGLVHRRELVRWWHRGRIGA